MTSRGSFSKLPSRIDLRRVPQRPRCKVFLAHAVHPQVLLQRRLKDWKIGRLKLAADLAEGFLDKGEYAEAARTFDICTRYVVEDCDDAVYAQVISRIAALDGRAPSKMQPPLEALEW